MSKELTLQIFIETRWIDAAKIIFPYADSNDYSLTTVRYFDDYALEYLDCDGYQSASLNYPVSLFFDRVGSQTWLRFLDDILPSGAARRYWLKHLGLSAEYRNEQSYILLRDYALNPIGNMRIKQSFEKHNHATANVSFTQEEVVNHGCHFFKYAQDRGAMVAKTTGAGGEAPKFLLNYCDGKVWIDEPPIDSRGNNQSYLVKFPRGRQSNIDSDILRAEYHYYQELKSMGFNTISTHKMLLIEGPKYPSLWLPRFDIKKFPKGEVERLAVESVYAMLEMPPGTLLDHGMTIRRLIKKISVSHIVNQKRFQFDVGKFVIEWVKRDLLNLAFGNSDNHGRNTSFVRGSDFIKLAPIYDFAPMKADPEGVCRATTWGSKLEVGGKINFPAIADSLEEFVPAEHMLNELNKLATDLVGLKARLKSRGMPERILSFPAIGFDYLPEKLKSWGLKTM